MDSEPGTEADSGEDESRGLVFGPMDLLVAGTALSRGAVLATNNVREFSRIESLRLVDWTQT